MKRFLPLILILTLMAAAYIGGVHEIITFENLKEERESLLLLVDKHPILAPFSYIILYATTTALSIPGAIFLSIFGGFLFPQPLCILYVVIGATFGAVAIFTAATTALGDSLKQQAGPRLNKMREGFQEDAVSYLLFLRLVPVFPFWLVNLAPAFFGIPLRTFFWTTFFGIIPGAFVFTQAGTGLGAILDANEGFSIDAVFNIEVKIALIALGIFALLPTIIKKLRLRKTG